jgi:hypothetical protein
MVRYPCRGSVSMQLEWVSDSLLQRGYLLLPGSYRFMVWYERDVMIGFLATTPKLWKLGGKIPNLIWADNMIDHFINGDEDG